MDKFVYENVKINTYVCFLTLGAISVLMVYALADISAFVALNKLVEAFLNTL